MRCLAPSKRQSCRRKIADLCCDEKGHRWQLAQTASQSYHGPLVVPNTTKLHAEVVRKYADGCTAVHEAHGFDVVRPVQNERQPRQAIEFV